MTRNKENLFSVQHRDPPVTLAWSPRDIEGLSTEGDITQALTSTNINKDHSFLLKNARWSDAFDDVALHQHCDQGDCKQSLCSGKDSLYPASRYRSTSSPIARIWLLRIHCMDPSVYYENVFHTGSKCEVAVSTVSECRFVVLALNFCSTSLYFCQVHPYQIRWVWNYSS